MNRIDVLRDVCDLVDESINNTREKEKLLRYLDRAYKELLKREGKDIPPTPLDDTTELICENKNIDYLIFYTAWNYYLSEGDYDNASYYKTEVRYYKVAAPKEPIKIENVYGDYHE